jgi:steroid delta-isomerase-like uncharacterized protein
MKKLKLVLPIALVLYLMVGCQDRAAIAELEEFRAQAAVEEQNTALAMRAREAWSKGDIEALREVYSPDFVFHSQTGQDNSLEDSIYALKQQMATWPDRTYTVEDMFVKGDKVAFLMIFRATHTVDFEGLPATGNRVEIKSIYIIRIENGKIVEMWNIEDTLSFYQQLGMELTPKEEK